MTYIDDTRRDLAHRQSELRQRSLDRSEKPADPLRLVEVRDRYDSAYQSLGARGAPQPITGESAFTYRRRLASGLAEHSPAWKNTNLYEFGPDVLGVAEAAIIGDARAAAADHSRGNPDGSLREITKRADGGHSVTEFAGSPLSWMSRFMNPGRAVQRMQHNGVTIRPNRRSI